MTTKCIKIKNPCKICLAPVSQKNGLQCRGACQTWIHYKCLNYTAGKIKDVKAGTIQVTCPCPDCRTATLPKEYRTDEPFSCTNSRCPANVPPMCEHTNCPSFVDPPHKANQTSVCKMPPLGKCGEDCKEYAVPGHAPNVCQIQTKQNNSSTSSIQMMSPAYSSGQNVGDTQFAMQSTVAQMCNTVGQLTNQINELMCKMKEACNAGGGGFNIGGGRGGGGPGGGGPGGGPTCGHKGPKSMCPKPCFCPGNPVNNRR